MARLSARMLPQCGIADSPVVVMAVAAAGSSVVHAGRMAEGPGGVADNVDSGAGAAQTGFLP